MQTPSALSLHPTDDALWTGGDIELAKHQRRASTPHDSLVAAAGVVW